MRPKICPLYFFILVSIIPGLTSLRCYKCLNLDCPQPYQNPRENDKICQSIRSFIVASLSPYYELGELGYIGPCPTIDERVQWTLMQLNPDQCPYIRESATCSLGRLQIQSMGSSILQGPVISHATIMGCIKPALLKSMKTFIEARSCSLITKNSTTDDNLGYFHSLKLENCGKVTDYCNANDFCVPFMESVVKPFLNSDGHSRVFEAGLVAAIIVVVLVVIGAALLAGFCRNPLNRASNYSPARQHQNLNIINSRGSTITTMSDLESQDEGNSKASTA